MMSIAVWIWLGAVALFCFLEAATWSLISIWCAVGALAATFAAYFGLAPLYQLLLFVGVSLAAFAAVRPLARRFIEPRIVPTNADRLLGMRARVMEDIDNTAATGTVYADGKTWSARSASGDGIPAGTLVEIERMEGVKLIVRAMTAVSAA